MKGTRVFVRVTDERKRNWKLMAKIQSTTLSDFIITKVEDRLSNREKREILKFIEIQGNYFSKVENNINQLAKIANRQNYLSDEMQKEMISLLKEIRNLKIEQNKMFQDISVKLTDL